MASEMLFMDLMLRGKKVPGDSKIKGFENQIELKSLRWGLAVKDRVAGKGDDKADKNWNPKDLRLTKFFDGASTALFALMDERKEQGASTKGMLTKAVIANTAKISLVGVSAVKSGEKMPVLMVITVNGVRIKSMTCNAGESGSFLSLNEDLVFGYMDLQVEYFPAAKGGARGAPTSFKFLGERDD